MFGNARFRVEEGRAAATSGQHGGRDDKKYFGLRELAWTQRGLGQPMDPIKIR